MKDAFKVRHSYNKGTRKVSLQVDATKIDTSLPDSSVQGSLSISNTAIKMVTVTYDIGFKLISKNQSREEVTAESEEKDEEVAKESLEEKNTVGEEKETEIEIEQAP